MTVTRISNTTKALKPTSTQVERFGHCNIAHDDVRIATNVATKRLNVKTRVFAGMRLLLFNCSQLDAFDMVGSGPGYRQPVPVCQRTWLANPTPALNEREKHPRPNDPLSHPLDL